MSRKTDTCQYNEELGQVVMYSHHSGMFCKIKSDCDKSAEWQNRNNIYVQSKGSKSRGSYQALYQCAFPPMQVKLKIYHTPRKHHLPDDPQETQSTDILSMKNLTVYGGIYEPT